MRIVPTVGRVTAAALMLLLTGCKKPPPPAPAPPTVEVASPETNVVTLYAHFTGRTNSVADVDVRARVTGFLQSIHFQEGDIVQKGQVLFEIDPVEYKAAVQMQLAEWQAAVANMNEKQFAYERMREAYGKQVATQLELAEAKASYDFATAKVAMQKAEWVQANINLGYCTVVAPITGKVAKRMVDVGNLVGGSNATVLTTIIQQDPLYVNFDVSESAWLQVLEHSAKVRKNVSTALLEDRPNLPFDVGLGEGSDYPYTGALDYSGNQVDPNTGTINCRGIVSNTKYLMMPGMFARVRVPYQKVPDATLVPATAIGYDQSGNYVYVVDDKNVVTHRTIELGGELDGWRQVTKGLEPKDRVVVKGLLRCRPGRPVTPKPATGLTPPTTQPARLAVQGATAKELSNLVPTSVPAEYLAREPTTLPTRMPNLLEEGETVPIPSVSPESMPTKP